MFNSLSNWVSIARAWFEGELDEAPKERPVESPPMRQPLPPEERHHLQVEMDDVVQRRAFALPQNEDVKTEFFELIQRMSAAGVKPHLVSGRSAKNGWLHTQSALLSIAARAAYVQHFLSHPENAERVWSPSERVEYALGFSAALQGADGVSTDELLEDARLELESNLKSLQGCGLIVTMQVVRPE